MDYYCGQWANSNCPDPKELYESLVFKPDDVISDIGFSYWSKLESNSYRFHEFKDWHLYDYSDDRCISLAPSQERIQYGIKEIYFEFYVNSTIYIHTPGMFSKGINKGSKMNVEFGKLYFYEVNHEFHELLDYGGDHCNDDKTYQMDACNYDGVEKKSMEMPGCTTPYGPNKTKICTNSTKGSEAQEIYDSYMYS